ncbi:MAG: hypothetical protein U0176_07340 [Bacteroidia bacterium]
METGRLALELLLGDDFFKKFGEKLSLKVLGLQLSTEDAVSKVNGRIARSFDDAVNDLAGSISV